MADHCASATPQVRNLLVGGCNVSERDDLSFSANIYRGGVAQASAARTLSPSPG
jgi:hypothetical protein